MHRSIFGFDEDPFFSMHSERMGGADEIFSSFFGPERHLALAGRINSSHHRSRQNGSRDTWQMQDHVADRDQQLLTPAGAMNPFDSLSAIMHGMRNMMDNFPQNVEQLQSNPDSQVYTQSSVMTYTNMGSGQPKVYQATSAVQQMPGGLRETRKAVRDSEAGLEKMAIGRHIYDRGNVITRQRNTHTGAMDENRDYINMAEEESPQFESEWQDKTRCYHSSGDPIGQSESNNYPRVTGESGRTRHREKQTAAIEAAPRRQSHRHTAPPRGSRHN